MTSAERNVESYVTRFTTVILHSAKNNGAKQKVTFTVALSNNRASRLVIATLQLLVMLSSNSLFVTDVHSQIEAFI